MGEFLKLHYIFAIILANWLNESQYDVFILIGIFATSRFIGPFSKRLFKSFVPFYQIWFARLRLVNEHLDS